MTDPVNARCRNTQIAADRLRDVHGGECHFCHDRVVDPHWLHRDERATNRAVRSLIWKPASATRLGAELDKCVPVHVECFFFFFGRLPHVERSNRAGD